MGLTREEANLLEPVTELASTHPPSSPLKIKIPGTRSRSNSISLYSIASSPKTSTKLTGPPSPSVSEASGSAFGPGSNLASSLWPHQGEYTDSFPLSALSSTPSESKRDSETGAVEGRRLPPISSSRKSDPSEPLPSLIPQLSEPSSPSTCFTLASLSRVTGAETNPFPLRPATVNWGEFVPGSSTPSFGWGRQRRRKTFWAAIQEAGVPIYLGTPGFDAFSLCPFALGTYCSPTALSTAFSDSEVYYHAYAAGQKLSREDLSPSKNDPDGGVLLNAADAVLAEYGTALIERNAGQHLTFICSKQDTTSDVIVRKAHRLVQRFQNNGVAKDKIVVSIPATEQGIHATKLLVKEDGILVNAAMVTGMSHAAVCAEAGAAWITFHTDRLEKVYGDLGEPSRDISAIQSTIALFDVHDVQTKVMISGFRDIRKILEFPGAHGFAIIKEQIGAAQDPTARSYCISPQSASSLPESAVVEAKRAKWPPRFFDAVEVGGSNGSFIRHFTSREQTILFSTQRDLFYHTSLGIRDFLTLVRDEVVNYRIFMMQLSNPQAGIPVLAREGVKGFQRLVNKKMDLRRAEVEWKRTTTGRFLPDVEWIPAKVDKCEAWITADGRIEAVIPEEWDRREVVGRDTHVSF